MQNLSQTVSSLTVLPDNILAEITLCQQSKLRIGEFSQKQFEDILVELLADCGYQQQGLQRKYRRQFRPQSR